MAIIFSTITIIFLCGYVNANDQMKTELNFVDNPLWFIIILVIFILFFIFLLVKRHNSQKKNNSPSINDVAASDPSGYNDVIDYSPSFFDNINDPDNKDSAKTLQMNHGQSAFAPTEIFLDFAETQGKGKRNYQEDVVWISDTSNNEKSGTCFVLADGMGGMENGHESAKIAADVFSVNHTLIDPTDDIPIQLCAIAEHANNLIFEKNESENVSGGTTLLCLLIIKSDLYWLSIGDSTIFLFRNGIMNKVNLVHELAYQVVEQQLRNIETGLSLQDFSTEDLHKLTSSLGAESIHAIDQNIYPFELRPGDRILMSSDGVSDFISEDEILYSLRMQSAENCIEQIATLITEKAHPAQDNYSAIAIFCQ